MDITIIFNYQFVELIFVKILENKKNLELWPFSGSSIVWHQNSFKSSENSKIYFKLTL